MVHWSTPIQFYHCYGWQDEVVKMLATQNIYTWYIQNVNQKEWGTNKK